MYKALVLQKCVEPSRRTRIGIIGFILVTLAAGTAVAQETKNDKADGSWSGSAEASLVALSGNSNIRTFGLGGEATYDPGEWRWFGRFRHIETESDEQLQARSRSGLIETSRRLSGRIEAYGRGGYLRDLFAGIEGRLTTEGGLAYLAIRNAPHSLRILFGLGVTREKRAVGNKLVLGTASATGRYTWEITKTGTLTEEAVFVAGLNGGDDWRFTNEAAATASLGNRLSLKVSHRLSYLNMPVPGFRRTDSILSTALVTNF